MQFVNQFPNSSLSCRIVAACRHMIQYCADHGMIEQANAANLIGCIGTKEKKQQRPPDTESQSLQTLSSLDEMLGMGQSTAALQHCVEIINKHPHVWDDPKSRKFYSRFKKALKGELACIGLQLKNEGLTKAVTTRIQRTSGLATQFDTMPWMIGRENYCTLQVLKHLLEQQVQQKFHQPQSPNNDTQVDDPDKQTTEAPFDTTDEKESASAPLTITESHFQELLGDQEKVNTLWTRMHDNREACLPEAKAWMVFFLERYAGKGFPAFRTHEGTVLNQVVSSVTRVFLHDLFQQTKSAMFPQEKYRVCQEIMETLIKQIHPLLEVCSCTMKQEYQALLKLIRRFYLTPLQEDIRRHSRRHNVSYDAVWGQLTTVHRLSSYYEAPARVQLRRLYTDIFFCYYCEYQYTCNLLNSRHESEVQEALYNIEKYIFDRQYFYSWSDNRVSCEQALKLVQLASKRLEELAQKNSEKWLPIQQRFQAKVMATGFLRIRRDGQKINPRIPWKHAHAAKDD